MLYLSSIITNVMGEFGNAAGYYSILYGNFCCELLWVQFSSIHFQQKVVLLPRYYIQHISAAAAAAAAVVARHQPHHITSHHITSHHTHHRIAPPHGISYPSFVTYHYRRVSVCPSVCLLTPMQAIVSPEEDVGDDDHSYR